MKRRYIGAQRWDYDVPKIQKGTVVLPVVEGNYAEDEAMARHYVRLKLNLKKLPKGTTVTPSRLA